jgi:hypothetical protein
MAVDNSKKRGGNGSIDNSKKWGIAGSGMLITARNVDCRQDHFDNSKKRGARGSTNARSL